MKITLVTTVIVLILVLGGQKFGRNFARILGGGIITVCGLLTWNFSILFG